MNLPGIRAPDRSGAPWIADEDRMLLDLWKNQNLPVERIAEQLRRSVGAINSRIAKLSFNIVKGFDVANNKKDWISPGVIQQLKDARIKLADSVKIYIEHRVEAAKEERIAFTALNDSLKELHNTIEGIEYLLS